MSTLRKGDAPVADRAASRRWSGVDATRSRTMAAVKQGGTEPELEVRSELQSLGYRFQVLARKLPGTPDIVLTSHKVVIFVHGCYWHGHSCPHGKRQSRTNTDYWLAKIRGNQARDKRNLAALRKNGWRALVIWECQIKKRQAMRGRMQKFLDGKTRRV